jgi:hypothetical protein
VWGCVVAVVVALCCTHPHQVLLPNHTRILVLLIQLHSTAQHSTAKHETGPGQGIASDMKLTMPPTNMSHILLQQLGGTIHCHSYGDQMLATRTRGCRYCCCCVVGLTPESSTSCPRSSARCGLLVSPRSISRAMRAAVSSSMPHLRTAHSNSDWSRTPPRCSRTNC